MFTKKHVSVFLFNFGRAINLTGAPSHDGKRFKTKIVGTTKFAEEFIKRFTVISKDHLTPELNLFLITPNCELWHSGSSEFYFETDPFWAIYWPGGQALSRLTGKKYILDNEHLFRGKNVVDIGSGCGACAIAAAKSNSSIVLANDVDVLSTKAIQLNANLNKVKIITSSSNLIGTNIDSLNLMQNNISHMIKWDVVLMGDMFYDTDFSEKLFSWICKLKSDGKTVLIGDPGRHVLKDYLQRGNIIQVAEYPILKDEHFGFTTSFVWKIV